MPITIACPSCSKRFDLPDSTAGKTARCKACGQVFKIPAIKRASPNVTSTPSIAQADRTTHKPPSNTQSPSFDKLRGMPLDEYGDLPVLEFDTPGQGGSGVEKRKPTREEFSDDEVLEFDEPAEFEADQPALPPMARASAPSTLQAPV